ncbi:MAG: undecaprenyl-diphosphate phosphatase [Calditrichaeota bacterium]|nr:MAG: undecaprenyl-diphosphate phosphatase [Calditrichota bacterium]MBL1205493.1 undecaprenyl-diphosphate phosphatase [Calditrichota bacterium]NOG45321.1 undecaprenyl-diphosphate phosphatase [Calditrichota bacterium]
MELIKSIILGLVQGLSEFLPISSSGHLVIFAEILNFHEEGIAFEVFVHFGTLLSILVAFRKELIQMIIALYQVPIKKNNDPELQEYFKWDLYVIIATIPAGVIGLTFKDQIETAFSNVLLVYFMLAITGLIMTLTPYLKDRGTLFKTSNTFLIGVAQAFAILPGISRSGSTIFTGLLFGIDRDKVARFSFIMSIPAVFGAVLLKTKDLMEVGIDSSGMLNYFAGTIVAFATGYLAIIWLLDIVKKGKLQWFGYYCFVVSALGLGWHFLG